MINDTLAIVGVTLNYRSDIDWSLRVSFYFLGTLLKLDDVGTMSTHITAQMVGSKIGLLDP